ncbi:OmpA family protein [Dongia soli]|uniref:OmpA family protein n=1 Tax=Dongia soli TaxID=600628 RepID=A0ABU5EAD7_9PROT|nr:OmpA family protein [Dongia soli]MDY0883318.1 OmpA family protein [Dongia soli]
MPALRRHICRWGFIAAAVFAVSACSSDEPPFPPTASGPDLTTVPQGLGSDSANAQYTDQTLEPQSESVPRPEPAPPPTPKAAEGEAPEAAPPGEAQPSTEPGTPAAPPTPSEQAAPTPTPAPAAKNSSGYPDINTVPMERPTPEPNMEPDQPPADDQSNGSPQSLNAVPNAMDRLAGAADEELTIITAAGDVDTSDTQADTGQIAQADNQPDPLFGQTTLPPYIGYDDAQKQARSQQLYHSPYTGAVPGIRGTAIGGPVVLSGTSNGGSAAYGNQPGIYVNYAGTGPQVSGPQGFGQPVAGFADQPGGEPVGLIYFGNGSAQLSADDRRILKQVARMQKTYGGVVRVVGHASSRTEDMPLDRHYKANADMSQQRAQAVAAYLVRLGVDASLVQVAGVSDSRPVYPEIMPSGEAANRRAEIYLSSN